MSRPHLQSISIRGMLLAAALLAIGPAACASPRAVSTPSGVEAPRCASFKIGEVRGVVRGGVQEAVRRMGGDFARSRADTPGGNPNGLTTYSAEIFRYSDPTCRAGR